VLKFLLFKLPMGRPSLPLVDLAIRVNTTQQAGFLQISIRKLLELTHRGKISLCKSSDGVPVPGAYQLNKATAEYLSWLQGNQDGKGLSAFDTARAQRALAAAELSKLRTARMSGRLIEAESALEAVDTLILRLRAKLTAAIPRLAREVYRASSPQHALEVTETLIGEALLELRKLKVEDLVGRSGLRVVSAREPVDGYQDQQG
jgi:hypothetical protein